MMYIDIDDFQKVSSGGATKLSELQIDTDLDMGDYNILTEGEYYGSLNSGISIRIKSQDVAMMNNNHTQFNTELYSTTGGPISIQDIIIDADLNMGNYDISMNGGDITTTGVISGILDSEISIGNRYVSTPLMDSSHTKINPDLYDASGGLPSGLDFTNGILTISGAQRGLVIPDVLRIDNKPLATGGTNYNMLLENYEAEYLIADDPTPPTPTQSILLRSDGKVITVDGSTTPTFIESDIPEVRYTIIDSQLIMVEISPTYSKNYTLSKNVSFICENKEYTLKEIRYLEDMSRGFPMIPESVEHLMDAFNDCPNLDIVDISNCTRLNLEEVDAEGIRLLTHCFGGTTTGTLLVTESQKLKMDSLLEQDTEQNWVFKHNNNVKIEVILK